MKNKLLVTTILLLTSLTCNAERSIWDINDSDDWTYTLSYNVFTYHHTSDVYGDEDFKRGYQEDNGIVGVRVGLNENLGVFLGEGENSFYADTYMGGLEFSTSTPNTEVGSDVGIASGYDEIIRTDYLPFVNPFLRHNIKPTPHDKFSAKVGVFNFVAFNVFLEYTRRF